jgi:pyruvate dehydrogenase (quinone)
MRTVADQFAETPAAAGVKRIYGIVGDNRNGLTGAIFCPAWTAFASGW